PFWRWQVRPGRAARGVAPARVGPRAARRPRPPDPGGDGLAATGRGRTAVPRQLRLHGPPGLQPAHGPALAAAPGGLGRGRSPVWRAGPAGAPRPYAGQAAADSR